jgi:hypothetical protein
MKIEQMNNTILTGASSREASSAESNPQSDQTATVQDNSDYKTTELSSSDSYATAIQDAFAAMEKTRTKASPTNELELKSVKNDLREAFRELGIVPPPSMFGGVQLPSDVEFQSFPRDSENPIFQKRQTTSVDVMKLMMVKDMAKRMADRLKDSGGDTQQNQDSSSVNAVE